MSRHLQFSRVWTTCYSLGELRKIEIQILIRSGLPKFDIIGLPQNTIKEGKDRILSSLMRLGISLPSEKILVNLIPSDLPKEGSHFDLPILYGILQCLGVCKPIGEKEFLWGELKLDGSIQAVPDLLALSLFASSFEPSLSISGGESITLNEIYSYVNHPPRMIKNIGELLDQNLPTAISKKPFENFINDWISFIPKNNRWESFQASDRQRLLLSLASIGRHHILFEGPPGSGKSSWCLGMQELQSPLTEEQWLNRFIHQPGMSKQFHTCLSMTTPPFESPHHSASMQAIVGGGTGNVQAGSITKANHGILFLDEFNQFQVPAIEALREPLENKNITIARRGESLRLPANIQLLAAQNPCVCGNYRTQKLCICSPSVFNRYRNKVSGPIKDRIHWKIWWQFESSSQYQKWSLQETRQQIINAQRAETPDINEALIPEELPPRRKRIWKDLADSWCRWFQIKKMNQKDAKELNQFSYEMEHADETIN